MTIRRKSTLRVIAVAFALVFLFSASAFAGDKAQQEMVVPDLLIGRPLGFLGLAVGSVVYVVTLPATLAFGWQEDASETLVKKPYRFTFKRGLGEDLTSTR